MLVQEVWSRIDIVAGNKGEFVRGHPKGLVSFARRSPVRLRSGSKPVPRGSKRIQDATRIVGRTFIDNDDLERQMTWIPARMSPLSISAAVTNVCLGDWEPERIAGKKSPVRATRGEIDNIKGTTSEVSDLTFGQRTDRSPSTE